MHDDYPHLVRRAMDAARRIGFATSRAEVDPDTPAPSCSLPEAGRVLAMLAAGCHRIGEIGTGTGAGAAWMASAMPASATLVTVEVDADRAHAATEVFADDPRVRVLHDDAATALPRYAPFDLLFADGRWPDRSSLVDLLRVGGRVVMDDVTPVAALPPDSPFRSSDPKRDFFFANPRLVSAEIVLPDLANSVLVGTRVS